jgi:hypothetical protein
LGLVRVGFGWHPAAMDRSPVDEITRVQHSLITTEQFVATTGSEAALRWAVRDGWLERYRNSRSLYIVAGAPLTPYQPHMGACLLAGPNAACSKFAGAWLWDCPDIAECAPQLTFFGCRARRIPGASVHESRLDAAAWIVHRHGIPTVAAPLVVVQLAQLGAGYLAERVANDFFKRHVTDARAIVACLELVGRRKQGSAQLRAFCLRALEIRGHDDSPAARDLGVSLVRAGVPPFATQHHVCVGRHDYFFDFAWPEQMVGLEYAGWRDHGITRDSFDRDALRRSRLTAAGWRILDATSMASHAEVIRWVLATLTGPRLPLS